MVAALKAQTDAHGGGGRTARGAALVIPTGETGAAGPRRARALDAIGEQLRRDGTRPSGSGCRQAPNSPGRAAGVGDRVIVGALGLEGIVQALHERDAEVDVRGKRLRARVDELRVLVPAGAIAGAARQGARQRRAAAARGVAHAS